MWTRLVFADQMTYLLVNVKLAEDLSSIQKVGVVNDPVPHR